MEWSFVGKDFPCNIKLNYPIKHGKFDGEIP